MKIVEEYTHLGPDRRDKYKGMRFFDADTNINLWSTASTSTRNTGWMAHILLLGDEENKAEASPYALDNSKNETDLKRMIDHYSAERGVCQHQHKPKGARDSQRERIRAKLANKVRVLRRLGCHPSGLDAATSRLVAGTMCDTISIDLADGCGDGYRCAVQFGE